MPQTGFIGGRLELNSPGHSGGGTMRFGIVTVLLLGASTATAQTPTMPRCQIERDDGAREIYSFKPWECEQQNIGFQNCWVLEKEIGDFTISKIVECRTSFEDQVGFDEVAFSCHITHYHFTEIYLASNSGEFIVSGVTYDQESKDLETYRQEGLCI